MSPPGKSSVKAYNEIRHVVPSTIQCKRRALLVIEGKCFVNTFARIFKYSSLIAISQQYSRCSNGVRISDVTLLTCLIFP